MTMRHEHRFGFGLAWGCAVVLLVGGCETTAPTAGNAQHASPAVNSPSAVDVRTEAAIIDMENRYIAEKNSQPTYQHLAEAEAEQKRKEAAAVKAKADEQAKQESKEPTPAPAK
jgi:hypothetical protein